MLKSARLVLSLGVILGMSVATLPNASFAATSIIRQQQNVSATINGYLSFTATNHEANAGVTTWDSLTDTYSGVFSIGDTTDNFGTTTFQVICNYISDPAEELNGDCSKGWQVKAESEDVSNGYAAMVPSDQTNNYRILSTTPASAQNPISSTTANWLLKVNGISKTFSGSTFSTSPASGYSNFNIIPAKNNATAVAEGNTFRTINSVKTYIGEESFEAQYGFSAGGAVAGTYTGTVTYTLHIKAS